MKSVRIRSFSGPYFPAFVLNTERYGVYLRIQSEYWKIQTRKTSNTDTLYAVTVIFETFLSQLYVKSDYYFFKWTLNHKLSTSWFHFDAFPKD